MKPTRTENTLTEATKAAVERARWLTFGVSAVSEDGTAHRLPGSGIFIAPNLGLTARHVLIDIWRMSSRVAMRGGIISTGVKLYQVPAPRGKAWRTVPLWDVAKSVSCSYSDMILLCVEPANLSARRLARSNWKNQLFDLQMLPPDAGERINAFGFSGRMSTFDPTRRQLEIQPEMTFSEGRVTAVYRDWRSDPKPDRPSILRGSLEFEQSSTNFACFETTASFDPGMSGGPVFQGNKLVGLVSTGWSLDKDRHLGVAPCSRAASLWPLMFMRDIPTASAPASFLSLLDSGVVHATDWVDAGLRTYVEEVAGRMRPRIRL